MPTLLFLQRNACFDSQALADFINSEDFGRIFGVSFADVKLSDPEAEPGGRTDETDGLPVIVGDEADDSAMNAGDDEAVEVEEEAAAAVPPAAPQS